MTEQNPSNSPVNVRHLYYTVTEKGPGGDLAYYTLCEMYSWRDEIPAPAHDAPEYTCPLCEGAGSILADARVWCTAAQTEQDRIKLAQIAEGATNTKDEK